MLVVATLVTITSCSNNNDYNVSYGSTLVTIDSTDVVTDVLDTESSGNESVTSDEADLETETLFVTEAESERIEEGYIATVTLPVSDFDTLTSISINQNDTETNDKNISAESSNNKKCVHNYKLEFVKDSSCTVAGYKTYSCSKCKHSYTEPLDFSEHNYTEATCTGPMRCNVCSIVFGSTLGHSYGSDDKCVRCGVKNYVDDNLQDLTVSVKNDKNISIKNVTVSIYKGDNSNTFAVGKTNSKGVFTVRIDKGSSYKIVLSDLPSGYAAEEGYIAYNTTRANIKLKTVSLENSSDHSTADYKVGSKMWDFTVTDIDGKEYNLYDILQEQKLIIIDFWYVACVPCKNEFPYFESVHNKYKDDVTILAMNHFDNEGEIKRLRDEMRISFPLVKENIGLKSAFDVTNYPTTIIIDSSGRIISIHREPYESEKELFDIIDSLLK